MAKWWLCVFVFFVCVVLFSWVFILIFLMMCLIYPCILTFLCSLEYDLLIHTQIASICYLLKKITDLTVKFQGGRVLHVSLRPSHLCATYKLFPTLIWYLCDVLICNFVRHFPCKLHQLRLSGNWVDMQSLMKIHFSLTNAAHLLEIFRLWKGVHRHAMSSFRRVWPSLSLTVMWKMARTWYFHMINKVKARCLVGLFLF